MESIKNKPYNSTDVFIKHVVYAAKYGAQPMFNILGQDQSFIERNNLDLLVIVVSVIFLFIILISKSIQFCCCKNKVTVSVSKKNK
uniref:Glucuronosyltransferase n=1 Tax=Rhabditophanes sp. KR3021 TaxID=114890 RepID=A0AC35TXM8_9BILA